MDTTEVLVRVLVVVVAARLGAEIAERLRQPAVLGELALGAIAGPSVFGLLSPDALLGALGALGAVVLLLEVGLETDVLELLRVGRRAVVVAVAGIVLPFAFAYPALATFPHGGGNALFLACALSATSVGITARVFADVRALGTRAARIVLGAAVVDDVLGLVVLAVLLRSLGGGGAGLGAALPVVGAVAFLVVGAWAVPRCAAHPFAWVARHARSRGALLVAGLALALGLAALGEALGLSAVVGAFLAGLAVARLPQREEFARALAPVGHLLVPVFFFGIGVVTDVGALARADTAVLAGVLLAAGVGGKVLAGFLAGRGDGLTVGVGMVPRGEVGLVFAALGRAGGLLTPAGYAALVGVVLVTTFVTPVLLRRRVAGEAVVATPGEPAGAEAEAA